MTSQVGESIQTVVVVCVEAFPPYRDSLCGGNLEYLEDTVRRLTSTPSLPQVLGHSEVEVKVEVEVEVDFKVEVVFRVEVRSGAGRRV